MQGGRAEAALRRGTSHPALRGERGRPHLVMREFWRVIARIGRVLESRIRGILKFRKSTSDGHQLRSHTSSREPRELSRESRERRERRDRDAADKQRVPIAERGPL